MFQKKHPLEGKATVHVSNLSIEVYTVFFFGNIFFFFWISWTLVQLIKVLLGGEDDSITNFVGTVYIYTHTWNSMVEEGGKQNWTPTGKLCL